MALNSFSQNNVGINNSNPDPSAALDIAATDMGLLIPRMTTSERINITSPANGLLVFDTDTRSFWYYDSNASTWKIISNSGSSNIISDTDGDTYVTAEKNPDNDTVIIYIAGTEKFRLGHKGIEVLNTGNSVYIGEGAGKNDDMSGLKNVAIGTAALENSTGRSGLVAIGDSALFNNSVGASVAWHSTDNTAIGAKALQSNTIGDKNTATGANSLSSNTIGYYNTANGFNALASNITGAWNTAIGFQSGFLNTTGCNNTGCGNQSLYNNNGNRNCAYGDNSMLYNSVGSDNTAVGYHTLQFNTTGNYNTAIGSSSNEKNISGHSNVAVGVSTLYHNQTQSNLVAVGDSALFNNGTGASSLEAKYNTAVGSKSLYSNTTGRENTALGYNALFSNVAGFSNVAIGHEAMYSSTAYKNTAIGYQTLYSLSTGYHNYAGGYMAMFECSSGIYNTAVGSYALNVNDIGNYNVGVGNNTLDPSFGATVGDYNTACGSSAGPFLVSGLSNTGAFGYEATPTANDQIRIGNSSISSIGGFVGWTNLSDERFKTNISENVAGLEFILKLRPVTYNFDVDKIDEFLGIPDSLRNNEVLKKAARKKEAIIQTGFIAQEVEQAAQSLGYDFSGVDAPKNEHDFYGLRYAEFVVPLVKAIQEQQEIIETLEARIKDLENKLNEF